MQRFKTFVATGLATAGRIYAGDLNAIQDAAAGLYELTQNIGAATLSLGEAGLQLVRYGAGEARLTGALRTDGILRALGGDIPGTFTTAARDALLTNQAPYGLRILNTDNNRYEWNKGTDAARNWQPLGTPGFSGTYATRPAASTALNGVTYTAPDTGGTWLCVAGAWVLVAQLSPIMTMSQFATMLTNMGGAPYDKQRASVYGDAAGTLWEFEYDSNSLNANKWECIGGPEVLVKVDTQENTANATPTDLATVGPSFVIPRAGDYILEWGFTGVTVVGTPAANAIATISKNGASTTVAIGASFFATTSTGHNNNAVRKYPFPGLAAGDTMKLSYSSSNGVSIGFTGRWLSVKPIRIG